jgi:hypothetical protein
MCSGGKDSMASAIVCYENGIHLDGVVIAEIMFSHEKNISAEHPKHAEWLHNVAIPLMQNKFGFEVIVLRGKTDYLNYYHGRVQRSKVSGRIGKKRGFVLGGNMCALKRDCKISVLNAWCKQQGEFEKIIGIAADEAERLASLHKQKNARSVLEEYAIAEAMTYGIDRKYNLLSPYYDLGIKRQGCWFCPNCSIKQFAMFAKEYPELWEELRTMSEDTETVSNKFKYDMTFEMVDHEVEAINSQISFFE